MTEVQKLQERMALTMRKILEMPESLREEAARAFSGAVALGLAMSVAAIHNKLAQANADAEIHKADDIPLSVEDCDNCDIRESCDLPQNYTKHKPN